MLRNILMSTFLFFGIAGLAHADFVDIRPQQLQKFLDGHEKVVVMFDSSDPKCIACEPADGGPFKSLSKDYGPSIQFARVRWGSPWWKFPPALKPLLQQANIMAIPTVVGFENTRPVFDVLGRMKNTDAVRQKIDSTLNATPQNQK